MGCHYNRPIVISPLILAVKWISMSMSSSMLILKLFFFSSLSTCTELISRRRVLEKCLTTDRAALIWLVSAA